MAGSSSIFIIFTLLSSFIVTPITGKNDDYAKTLNRSLFGLKKEKLTHFRCYWHDILSGPKPSSMLVVPPPSNTSTTAFGLMNMIDNPLTVKPELSSKTIGFAEGFYASASQRGIGLLMAMNFAFIDGKYNGSTITVLGRNEVFNKVREMPVIGGSGLFRFARGYVEARTHTFDLKSGDAIIEYNVYVLHY